LENNLERVDFQVLSKGERRIAFEQFEEALKHLAAKKYGNAADRFDRICHLVTVASPVSASTASKTPGVYGKLTDRQYFTGSQKNRFDVDGNYFRLE
jgi:hypothetical protein